MSYEVRCECGKPYPVSAADAGVSFPCPCGREIEVPNLHALRAAAGEMGVSPAVQLQAMLLQNELPGTPDCACCHRRTEHLIRVSIVCERTITENALKKPDVAAGCLGALLFGLPGLLLLFLNGSSRRPEQHGTDVSFVVPVRACESCARDLATPVALRRALRALPVCAALLDYYPKALIRLVS